MTNVEIIDVTGNSNNESQDEIEDENLCKYCFNKVDPYNNPALQCSAGCDKQIHIRCLRSGGLPTNFLGDVFYDLSCAECNPLQQEVIMRDKMSWLTTMTLVLYNLREKSSGISRRGYFHWKSDISVFVDRNWEHLFKKTVKRKKNWIGTISGTLSHYNGSFFQSGTAELGDSGWWKLNSNEPPEVLMDQYNKFLDYRKQNANQIKALEKEGINSTISSEIKNPLEFSFSNGYENHGNFNANQVLENGSTNSNHSTIKEEEFIIPDQQCFSEGNVLDVDNMDVDDIGNFAHFNNLLTSNIKEEPFMSSNAGLPDIFLRDCLDNLQEIKESNFDFDQVNMANMDCGDDNNELSVDSPEMVESKSEYYDIIEDQQHLEETLQNQNDMKQQDKNFVPPAPSSLFRSSACKPLPWESKKKYKTEIVPLMNQREEEYLLQQIEKYKHLLDNASPAVRRMYRKLAVRKLKRENGLPVFNLDTFDAEKQQPSLKKKGANKVLDRFVSYELINALHEQRLVNHCEPTSVHSPYTNRVLKPFIRRDTTSEPLWLKVTNELLRKVHEHNFGWTLPPAAPIDYSYIRPQHIPALNSLCTQYFWPGIDLTECLQYPDFTCVVSYKKVIIGFATMVPDIGYNEAYITFIFTRPEWRKAGIGSFMLYHLIQTCMGKDITLHVSATNPALILYQKFGFKIEEFVQDFYDKYIPPSSKDCRHALFLRLSR